MTMYRCMSCQTRVMAVAVPKNCRGCGAGSAWMRSEAEVSLPGFDLTAERVAALADSERERLEAMMRMPCGDVSARAGAMERDSPLFWGKGDSPTLF